MRDILTKEFHSRRDAVLSDIKELKAENPILWEILDYMSKMHDMCLYPLFMRTNVVTDCYLDFLEDVVAVLYQTFLGNSFLGRRWSIYFNPGYKDLETLEKYGGINEDGYVHNLTGGVLKLFLKGKGVTQGKHICDTHEAGSIPLQRIASPHFVFGQDTNDGHFFEDPNTLLSWLKEYHTKETSKDFNKLGKVDKSYLTRNVSEGKKLFPRYLETFMGPIRNKNFINTNNGGNENA